jgi:hypothetical protein
MLKLIKFETNDENVRMNGMKIANLKIKLVY